MRIEAGKAIQRAVPGLKRFRRSAAAPMSCGNGYGRWSRSLWPRSHPQTHQVAGLRAGVKLMQIALGAVGLPVGTPRDTSAAPLADVSNDGFAPALDALRRASTSTRLRSGFARQLRWWGCGILPGMRRTRMRCGPQRSGGGAATVVRPPPRLVSAEHADAVDGCAWVLGKLEGGGPSSSIEPLRGRIVEVTRASWSPIRSSSPMAPTCRPGSRRKRKLTTLGRRRSPIGSYPDGRGREPLAAGATLAQRSVCEGGPGGRTGRGRPGGRKAADQRQRFEDRLGADASSGLRATVGALVDDAAKAKAQAHLDASALADGYRFDAKTAPSTRRRSSSRWASCRPSVGWRPMTRVRFHRL